MSKILSSAVSFLVVFLVIAMIITPIWGTVLAFQASIMLGIISIMLVPSLWVYGICAWFGLNVPEKIQAWAQLPV